MEMGRWEQDGLHRDIAELEGLLARAKDLEDDIDVRWVRKLFEELLQRRRDMLRRLQDKQRLA